MNYPSVKTLMSGLDVDKEVAGKIRRYMRQKAPYTALCLANKLIDGSMGVEYISAVTDSLDSLDNSDGIEYLNFGDTYVTTLLFDYKKERFYVRSWGDVVESNPRRFTGY